MKKMLLAAMVVLFLAGCGTAARESGFYEHDTMYKDWDHLKFSICGYPKADKEDAKESKAGKWWGNEIDVTGK